MEALRESITKARVERASMMDKRQEEMMIQRELELHSAHQQKWLDTSKRQVEPMHKRNLSTMPWVRSSNIF
jgi:hypothetical protein